VYKGVLFSTSSQPGWRDARWLGGYHASSAVVLGCASLLAIAVFAGQDRAAATLRLALSVVLLIHVVPLWLLLWELWPAVSRRQSRARRHREVVLALGAGALFPLCLLAAGTGPITELSAVVLILLGSWTFRALIVLLPHQGLYRGDTEPESVPTRPTEA